MVSVDVKPNVSFRTGSSPVVDRFTFDCVEWSGSHVCARFICGFITKYLLMCSLFLKFIIHVFMKLKQQGKTKFIHKKFVSFDFMVVWVIIYVWVGGWGRVVDGCVRACVWCSCGVCG